MYIIYQCGKGDRLGWSGLLTLQLLSVFIDLEAWASRPQHSDFQIGHADSDTGGEGDCSEDLKTFLSCEDLVCSHPCKHRAALGEQFFSRTLALYVSSQSAYL